MILEIGLVLTSTALLITGFYCYRFAVTILKVQDAIEQSLEVLDVLMEMQLS